MGFAGVCRALYDYTPQSEGELAITEGDLLYILEKGSDDWWKAKKKASAEEDDEPEGLIPNNYVEEAQPVARARALYEYTRQTDEEISFPEDSALDVYDTSDPDWILVGTHGDYGFAPSNYIETEGSADAGAGDDVDEAPSLPPALPSRPPVADSPVASPSSPVTGPAAALASVMQGRKVSTNDSSTPPPQLPRRPTSDLSDEEMKSPPLPTRPVSVVEAPRRIPEARIPSPEPTRYHTDSLASAYSPPTPGRYHLYNVNEMVSVMGKKKKMPTTLGINLGTGTILIEPERAQDGPSQEWTAEKMIHYSREGKHVFLELVKPSKSVDFHAGAKDTAEEIVVALSDLAASIKAIDLHEAMESSTAAGRSQKRGQVLYDFMAQGDDEVTVAVGDEVIVVDDTKSEEWWHVRRVKNGKEGVVPSSYIEVTGIISPPPSQTGTNAGKSIVEQNRLEEIRLTKEAIKIAKQESSQQVGPAITLPERGSSLSARGHDSNSSQQRNHHENGRADGAKSKSKPDPTKLRTWTDRSKSFSVEAQFLGVKDGKINLHKVNGVKIAVPVGKMSSQDLEYVESLTGISFGESGGTRNSRSVSDNNTRRPQGGDVVGVSVEQKPEYDWFQFFLDCDIAIGICERYARAFSKDSMDESVLPDVDASVLRNLGLREGDIIKVMRKLDARFGRTSKKDLPGDGSDQGGLFSGGPGGALRNNTRKRPTPATQTSDVVDAKLLTPGAKVVEEKTVSEPAPAPAPAPREVATTSGEGFEDDAWDIKQPAQIKKSPSPRPPESTSVPPPPAQNLAGSLKELSLLTQPLQPTKTQAISPVSEPAAIPQPPAAAPAAAQAPTGASPSFFTNLASQQTGVQGRQRPQAPQNIPGHGTLMPPPPSRPLSAPLTQSGMFGAPPSLVPHQTGVHPSIQGQVAAPGQSLQDLTQARMQEQYARQLQAQQQAMNAAYSLQSLQSLQAPGLVPAMTGMQPMMTGMPQQFPGVQAMQLQPQMTGFPGAFPGQPGPINTFLPAPLQPERTGMPQFQGSLPAIGTVTNIPNAISPPPQPPALKPLVPQQTGPAPQIRFGVQPDAKKLAPQPTGRRANLSHATPQNPFGF